MPASQGFTAVPTQAAARAQAGAHGPSRADGATPAAQALAPKKRSAFLQLFRRIAGGRKPAGSTEAGRAAAGTRIDGAAPAVAWKKIPATETAEFRAEASRARSASARRSRQARSGEELPAEAPAAAPAPAALAAQRRANGAAPVQAAPPAAQARREQRPAQARVFVLDLRPRPQESENQAETRRASAAAEPRSFERVLQAREAGAAEQAAPGSPGSPGSPGAGPTTSLSGLPGALRERLVPEIVERAGIVLREGGEGEILMVLKPEHLGSVRIRLHLGESSLEGRIVVDNSNVKELLDANLEQLKSALRQEGYTSANIDVTVSGGRGQEREPDSGQALPAVAGRPADEFQRSTPAVWDLGFTTVNLLA